MEIIKKLLYALKKDNSILNEVKSYIKINLGDDSLKVFLNEYHCDFNPEKIFENMISINNIDKNLNHG